MPKLYLTLLATATVATLSTPAGARNVRTWGHASSIGRDLLIVTALGMPALKRDWHGDIQAGESIGAAFALTYGLKQAFPELRPDGSDRQSFPSGHTSAAFAAAATMQQRYGYRVGIPAQLLAGFVGLARVEARKHFWYDVLAGTAIGEGAGFLLTSRHDQRVRVMPWGDAHSGGFALGARF